MSPRGGYTPGRRPSTGRPSKGGRRINLRLSGESLAVLALVRSERNVTATEAIEGSLRRAAETEFGAGAVEAWIAGWQGGISSSP